MDVTKLLISALGNWAQVRKVAQRLGPRGPWGTKRKVQEKFKVNQ